ncbi:hypothetical protein RUND412_010904 [Rhizina undulata]
MSRLPRTILTLARRSLVAPTSITRFLPRSLSSNSGSDESLSGLQELAMLLDERNASGSDSILSSRKLPTKNVDYNRDSSLFSGPLAPMFASKEEDQYHLHIYSHKHNTHIAFTSPKRDPIIALSCGNLGFKKAQRSTYDAAYQLAAHVYKKIDQENIRPKSLEVVLRGFGQGREACVKALLGQEGKHLRGAVDRVTDATRLKFGGTRSKKPRRLG